MNVFMLMTGVGPLVVLTSHASVLEDGFIAKLAEERDRQACHLQSSDPPC